jgi:Coenzyme PQQ synthesis protein D (PqqD)
MLPRRREEELVVRELAGETLVYDQKRNKAHCLNGTAALVWRNCDGQTSVAKIASLMEQELKIPADERLVWFALDRLGRAGLMQRLEPANNVARYSRRDAARKLGIALLAVPLVMTVIAPTAAMAASCAGLAQSCAVKPCCPGLLCALNLLCA